MRKSMGRFVPVFLALGFIGGPAWNQTIDVTGRVVSERDDSPPWHGGMTRRSVRGRVSAQARILGEDPPSRSVPVRGWLWIVPMEALHRGDILRSEWDDTIAWSTGEVRDRLMARDDVWRLSFLPREATDPQSRLTVLGCEWVLETHAVPDGELYQVDVTLRSTHLESARTMSRLIPRVPVPAGGNALIELENMAISDRPDRRILIELACPPFLDQPLGSGSYAARPPDWRDSISVGGDLRVRYEMIR